MTDWDDFGRREPKALVRVVRFGIVSHDDLVGAVKAMHWVKDSAEIRKAVVPLLGHSVARIREAAVLSLLGHLDDETREKVAHIMKHDAYETVRVAAQDVLESLAGDKIL